MSAVAALRPDTRMLIAGSSGLVGSALVRYFLAQGFHNLLLPASTELDLRDAAATEEFFADQRPQVVIDAAARVGGIGANASRPAEFISDNLRIQVNLLDSSVSHGVGRFLFLGSSCIYPKFAEQPITESALLTGPLEQTNEAYAMSKLAGIAHVTAIRRQYGLSYVSAMPTNLYGPADNFNPDNGHVLPSLIRRFHDAARGGAPSVTCWGTGSPRREFLHADDFAEACHVLLDHYDDDQPINVGTGTDVTIAELARLIADVVGYRGEILWDETRPDGTPRKVLDIGKVSRLGWKAQTALEDGIRATYSWFTEHYDDCRK